MKYQWVDEGKLRWCWLQIRDAALMLQEYRPDGLKAAQIRGKFGNGVSITFHCKNALEIYREVTARGARTNEPFVGNRLWVVGVTDPERQDGICEPYYVPEETKFSEWKR